MTISTNSSRTRPEKTPKTEQNTKQSISAQKTEVDTFRVSVTGIIHKAGKFLICKRSEKEKVFPSKWCVPGGKMEIDDFLSYPKDLDKYWFSAVEKVLKKEILEETNLQISNIEYVSSILLDLKKTHLLILSMCAEWKSGHIVLDPDELTEFAWVTPEEAKGFDMIPDIANQIAYAYKKYYN